MTIPLVKKRNGTIVDFDRSRIESAISRAYQASKVLIDIVSLSELVDGVVRTLETSYTGEHIPEVEDIQNIVEKAIADKGDFEVAKNYILYRDERSKERKRDIFKKRVYLKPYEYTELYEYVSAIRHSYWIHTEFNFVGDVQNFKVNLVPLLRELSTSTLPPTTSASSLTIARPNPLPPESAPL